MRPELLDSSAAFRTTPAALLARVGLPPRATRGGCGARRGFSLAELLVVIAIIAIVIALIVPALGGGRNAARKSATDKQIKEISNAAATFARDNSGRMPGYFTVREMGRQENAGPTGRGMSMSENVMLDLMGFQTGNLQVGPTAGNTVGLDPQRLGVPGSEGKQYYVPDKKYFVAQVAGISQMAQAPHAGADGDPAQLPDVVDAFGQPLLIWVEDDTYITKPSINNTNYAFARIDSGSTANSPGARHYWATNSCFLTAERLGKKGMDQRSAAADGSMIGSNATPNVPNSLEGALGNPNAAWRPPTNLNDLPSFRALASRAPFIVQSAGIDGVYFGKKDKGAKQFAGGFIDYRVNFAPNPAQALSATNQYTDRNGKPTNIDVLADFDDLFGFGGN